MNRRLPAILITAFATSLVAGCTTFESEPIASVNDERLEEAQLERLVSVLPPAAPEVTDPEEPPAAEQPLREEGDVTVGADARQAISIWILAQVQAAAIEARGLAIDAAASDQVTAELSSQVPGFDDLSTDDQRLLVDYVAGQQTLSEPGPATQALLDDYAKGPEVSGLICVSHILVEDEEIANDISARLSDGADFGEIASAESIDPGSAERGGDLGCYFTDEFSAQFIPEFTSAALEATVGEPTAPVATEFGYHIILVPEAERAADGLAQFESSLRYIASGADVHVNPRYGAFDREVGAVVPLT